MKKLAIVLVLIGVAALVVSNAEAYYAWAPYGLYTGYGYGYGSSCSYGGGYYGTGSYGGWHGKAGKGYYGMGGYYGGYGGGWWPGRMGMGYRY